MGEDSSIGRITEKYLLPCLSFLHHGLRVHIDDDVGDAPDSSSLCKVPAIQAVPDNDHVILHRGDAIVTVHFAPGFQPAAQGEAAEEIGNPRS